ncbi:MAG: hypothetical protein U1C74_28005 [Phenylobacterium sp.]|uniref:hypothetical protein n=1 Tax=Brevundimonas sp. TaxID=1871086 RepID=UPI00273799CF|nr:hypothetical protein [Brevundimonas sp.]MDP3801575.1 hypothetical protein [Brevundimonas sp.]MDZ4375245.1 hypothetical protein [Phenylobacterium sp.]
MKANNPVDTLLRAGAASSAYTTKVFLDANVVLEGKPLADLPWSDVDARGPILALFTPTALKEIDSKKRDGRLGKIARAFNRLIGTAIGGVPVVVRETGPRVEVTLAICDRIRWSSYDDLDPDDGDSRIVAEILHARGIDAHEKVLVSQDIKPLAFAARHGVRTHHMSEDWLRPVEPTPQDKKIQQLKHRVQELEGTEPVLEVQIRLGGSSPIPTYRVNGLTPYERELIENRILTLNPQPYQHQGMFGVGAYEYDRSLDDRYAAYRDQKVPVFVGAYERKIELLFNQVPFSVEVSNVGRVRADRFIIEIESSEGWLHSKFVFVPSGGPTAPRARSSIFALHRNMVRDFVPLRVGRHEVEFVEGPDRTRRIVANCEDFRHGQTWVFDGVLGLDAHRDEPAIITVRATAANLHGALEASTTVEKQIQTVHVSHLVDLEELLPNLAIPMQGVIEDAVKREDYDDLEIDEADDD